MLCMNDKIQIIQISQLWTSSYNELFCTHIEAVQKQLEIFLFVSRHSMTLYRGNWHFRDIEILYA